MTQPIASCDSRVQYTGLYSDTTLVESKEVTVGMVWIGWRPDTELNTDLPMVYKTPSGTSVEMHVCGWAAWWVV